jgi:RND family efflux transporter MFP subunit
MTRTSIRTFAALALTGVLWAQSPEMVAVVSKPIARTVDLPGEITPFLSVALHAKIAGYVERITVDRGSVVKKGDPLVELSAPEMAAQIAEANTKIQVAAAERLQAEAQVAAVQATYDRLKQASQTPGAIAGNELVQSEKQVEAAKAVLASREQAARTAESAVRVLRDMEAYLKITAPFDGVVTDRLVHPGALVGPGADSVLLVLQQVSRLRVVIAVPEEYAGTIANGAKVAFTVPAWPDRTFSGTVARVPHVLDQKTRTMPVELDASNPDGALAPGMYPTAKWPVRRSHPGLFVPRTSVVTTTERTFIVRNENGRAKWVDVRKGAPDGDLIEVTGDLKAGDQVVKRASDEIRDGAQLAGAKK